MSCKYLIIVGDGMADLPIAELGGKTILEAANVPNLDECAACIHGLAHTVPEGMPPGSDTANLSIFGYNPRKYYTGRAPLEALNLGIKLAPEDMAFRCNFVTLKDGCMKDFTADHIDSSYGKKIIQKLNTLNLKDIEFHAGVSYRNIMVWRNFPYAIPAETTPPHDITDRTYTPHLPRGEGDRRLQEIMQAASLVISTISSENPALHGTPTDIWLWGAGRKPALDTYQQKYGLSGVTVSAVDLIHGIGLAAGLTPIHVDGATGYLDTNYQGKVDAAVSAFEDHDFVFLHIEAPDESGHEGDLKKKMRAVEDFDAKVVGPMLQVMKRFDDYIVLVLPDHPTPISLRTHTSDPIPFAILTNNKELLPLLAHHGASSYSETSAKQSGLVVADASTLLNMLVNKVFPQ